MNWIWEMVQMPTYIEMAGHTWRETALTCTVAALGDVAMTLTICGLGSVAAADVCWGIRGNWNVYVTTALLGGLCAAAFEWFAQSTGRWTYSDNMALVPGLKLGLWPWLQLTLLTPLSFWTAQCAVKSLEHARAKQPPKGLVP
jgi:hypothetical protein